MARILKYVPCILKYVPCIFDKNFYLCASKRKTFIMLGL